MLEHKRVKKVPIPTIVYYPETQKQAWKPKKKSKIQIRCHYQFIPAPLQLRYDGMIHMLSGDFYVLERKKGMVWADLSIMSKFKNITTIQITKINSAKVIKITLEHKDGLRVTDETAAARKLKQSKNKFLRQLDSLLKELEIKLLGSISSDEVKKKEDSIIKGVEDKLLSISNKNNTKIDELIGTLPSLHGKLRLKGSNTQATEIHFNEKFAIEMGFCVDSLVTHIFQEGLPRMQSFESEAGDRFLRAFMENCAKLNEGGFVISDMNMDLMMKNGYARNVRIEGHILLVIEEGRLGLDTVFSITNTTDPYLNNELFLPKKLNKGLLQERVGKEKILKEFLAEYYHRPLTQRYASYEKVCRIKEISSKIEEKEEVLS